MIRFVGRVRVATACDVISTHTYTCIGLQAHKLYHQRRVLIAGNSSGRLPRVPFGTIFHPISRAPCIYTHSFDVTHRQRRRRRLSELLNTATEAEADDCGRATHVGDGRPSVNIIYCTAFRGDTESGQWCNSIHGRNIVLTHTNTHTNTHTYMYIKYIIVILYNIVKYSVV